MDNFPFLSLPIDFAMSESFPCEATRVFTKMWFEMEAINKINPYRATGVFENEFSPDHAVAKGSKDSQNK